MTNTFPHVPDFAWISHTLPHKATEIIFYAHDELCQYSKIMPDVKKKQRQWGSHSVEPRHL